MSLRGRSLQRLKENQFVRGGKFFCQIQRIIPKYFSTKYEYQGFSLFEAGQSARNREQLQRYGLVEYFEYFVQSSAVLRTSYEVLGAIPTTGKSSLLSTNHRCLQNISFSTLVNSPEKRIKVILPGPSPNNVLLYSRRTLSMSSSTFLAHLQWMITKATQMQVAYRIGLLLQCICKRTPCIVYHTALFL